MRVLACLFILITFGAYKTLLLFLEGALSIEVWGHRSASHKSKPAWVVEQTQLAKARSLADR